MAKTARLDETPKSRLNKLAEKEESRKQKASDLPVYGTRIDPKTVKRIRICAAHEDMTMQQFVIEAIEVKLEKMGY